MRSTVLLALVLTAPVLAAPVFIENAGFEEANLLPGQFIEAVPAGWQRAVNSQSLGTFFPTIGSWGYTASEGNDLLYTNGGFVQQTTSALLTEGFTYTLRVDVIRRPSFFSQQYSVLLLAGNVVIASDLGSLTPPVGGFLVSELVYTAGASDPLLGQPLAIRLGGPQQSNFDRVRLDAVPAPAMTPLLALAGLALIRRRR